MPNVHTGQGGRQQYSGIPWAVPTVPGTWQTGPQFRRCRVSAQEPTCQLVAVVDAQSSSGADSSVCEDDLNGINEESHGRWGGY